MSGACAQGLVTCAGVKGLPNLVSREAMEPPGTKLEEDVQMLIVPVSALHQLNVVPHIVLIV